MKLFKKLSSPSKLFVFLANSIYHILFSKFYFQRQINKKVRSDFSHDHFQKESVKHRSQRRVRKILYAYLAEAGGGWLQGT